MVPFAGDVFQAFVYCQKLWKMVDVGVTCTGKAVFECVDADVEGHVAVSGGNVDGFAGGHRVVLTTELFDVACDFDEQGVLDELELLLTEGHCLYSLLKCITL